MLSSASSSSSGTREEVVEYELRRYGAEGVGIGVITLSAPDRMNAFDAKMANQFKTLVHRLEREVLGSTPKSKAPRALVLRGRGPAFCAGGDLGLLGEIARSDDLEGNARRLTDLYASFLSIRRLKIPVVAAIHGYCVGGGAGIAVGCADVRVASRDTKLRFNFFRELGITPGMGTTAVLPALVGPAEAAKLLFQVPRRDASAEDLHRLGLACEVTADRDSAFEAACAIAGGLGAANPVATSSYLGSLRVPRYEDLAGVLEREGEEQAKCFASEHTRAVFKAIGERAGRRQGGGPAPKL